MVWEATEVLEAPEVSAVPVDLAVSEASVVPMVSVAAPEVLAALGASEVLLAERSSVFRVADSRHHHAR